MGQLIDMTVLAGMQLRGMRLDQLATIAPDEPTAIAAISASELMVTVHRATSSGARSEREAFVRQVLDAFPVVPFDQAVAQVYAEALVVVAATGGVIRASDLIVAATAMANGYALLTDNERDFERLPDLEVRNPTWPG